MESLDFGLSETTTTAPPEKAGRKITPVKDFAPISSDVFGGVLGGDKKEEPIVTETKAVETPTETVAAVTETPVVETKEAAPVDQEDYSADYKKHLESESFESPVVETTAETTTQATSAAPTEIPKETQEIVSQHNRIISNPQLKGAIDFVLAGGDLVTYVSQAQGVDVTAMDGEQLIREQCKREGVTDEEEIAVEIDSYNELSPLNKKKRANEIRSEIKTAQDQRMIDLGVKQREQAEQGATAQKQIEQKLQSDLNTIIAEKVDKDYFGIKATPDRLQTAKKAADNLLGLMNTDGTINAKELFTLAYLKTSISDMQKHYTEKYYKNGRTDEKKLHIRPDTMQTTSAPPVVEHKEAETLGGFMSSVEPIEKKPYNKN